MTKPSEPHRNLADMIFAGGGEMGALMRSHDWSQTPLGPVETWPQSLKAGIRIILGSRYPMFIWWGNDLINVYNDAYIPILGKRHPAALGESARGIWAELWHSVGPFAEEVLNNGNPSWNEEFLEIMERNDYKEETYFTFSYSPIIQDDDQVGGIFCACTEDTRRVVDDRRLRTLRELRAETAHAKTVNAACDLATTVLAHNLKDIPFALIYLLNTTQQQAQLASTTNLDVGTAASPTVINLTDPASDGWSLNSVLATNDHQMIEHLMERFGPLPGGAWEKSPQRAIALPLVRPGQRTLGILILGISPYRPLDEDYQGFFELVSGQISAAIANASAYEEERKQADALAELDRAKIAFFSNVSHDFRTPLTLMLGPAEDALADQREPLSPNQRQRIEVIQRNGLRLLKLVNTLLDFSQIESDRLQAVYEPTDLATFTAELASIFRSAIEQANLSFVVDCPPLPEPAYVDREMWEKIVLNLISNAFKFTFAGEIRVSVRWGEGRGVGMEGREQEAEGRRSETGGRRPEANEQSDARPSALCPLPSALSSAFPSVLCPLPSAFPPAFFTLQVQDTGIGIPAAEVPRLFERFHWVKGAQGRTFEGSGIGLSLVQELVKLHGGIIQVSSVEGEGSCFTVMIPAGSAHLPEEQIRPAQTLTSTAVEAAVYLEEALRWLPEASSDAQSSAVEVQVRGSEAQAPGSEGQMPGSQWQTPSSEGQMSGSEGQTPSSEGQMPGSEGQTPSSEGQGRGSEGQTPGSKAVRILLVDDNADMRDYLRRLLSQRWQVETAANGAIALDRIQQYLPDLVLSDVMMPVMDGVQLLKALRAHPLTKGIPVILLSARAGEEATIDGLEAGADDYLIKPFSARELMARVNTQLQMSRLRQEQSANRFKTEFLLTVTHELQAPLASVVGWTRLLQSKPYDPTITPRALATIERHALIEAKLIKDLLDVSHIMSGTLSLKPQLVDLLALVQNAVHAFQSAAATKDIQLTEAISTTIQGDILADGDRLKQVITNLLDNAIKFTPPGGSVTVELSVESGSVEAWRSGGVDGLRSRGVGEWRSRGVEEWKRKSGNEHPSTHLPIHPSTHPPTHPYIQIRVTDTGIGIAPDFLPYVFERFTQAEVPSRHSPGGVGIGLAIARHIVELQNGTIHADSAGPGQGTTFTVRLPLQQAATSH